MSIRMGIRDALHPDPLQMAIYVQVSGVGVELLTSINLTLQPVEARNYAALLVRAADEVERMRSQSELP